jgi:CO dehydrogenase maturation factor
VFRWHIDKVSVSLVKLKMNKIAITGKGGVGKSTIAAALAIALKEKSKNVWLLDCDPDANLATILNYPYPAKLKPIIELKEIIQERTQTKNNSPAVFYKMNPHVEDIPSKFSINHRGINLMLMGKVKFGGGCFCPENTFAKTLVSHLLLKEDEILIMDMEAGIEHLSRGTAGAVDVMLVVTEPSASSIETAKRIIPLAQKLGIKNISVVANKIRSDSDKEFIEKNFDKKSIVTYIPYNKIIEKNRGIISENTEF